MWDVNPEGIGALSVETLQGRGRRGQVKVNRKESKDVVNVKMIW